LLNKLRLNVGLEKNIIKKEINNYINPQPPKKGGKKKKLVNKHKSKRKVTKKKVRKIHKGPRGGKYYITKGRKVYI